MTDLNTPFSLTDDHLKFYQENEYIKLKDVFSPETLNHYREAIWQKTLELNNNTKPMNERDTYGKAFIQVSNLWTHCEIVKAFVFSKCLAQIAADLMDVDGVRMYHDQALFKEASGGFTPWHADQQYWPLATNKTITAWIPLVPISMDMGPLSFAAGSHRETAFRDLAISDASEKRIGAAMANYAIDQSPYDLGEVSFHSGWMYHNAGPNTSGTMRAIMTVIYMDSAMTLKEPENTNQKNDWQSWCPGVEVGAVCDSPLNPVLYQRGALS